MRIAWKLKLTTFRRPDLTQQRAAYGPRAVVCPHLLLPNTGAADSQGEASGSTQTTAISVSGVQGLVLSNQAAAPS